MKVSEKQLIILVNIAQESLRIAGPFGGFDLPLRQQLVNDILNQQSNDLKEIDSPTQKWVASEDERYVH